jgi:hypothetical protein
MSRLLFAAVVLMSFTANVRAAAPTVTSATVLSQAKSGVVECPTFRCVVECPTFRCVVAQPGVRV